MIWTFSISIDYQTSQVRSILARFVSSSWRYGCSFHRSVMRNGTGRRDRRKEKKSSNLFAVGINRREVIPYSLTRAFTSRVSQNQIIGSESWEFALSTHSCPAKHPMLESPWRKWLFRGSMLLPGIGNSQRLSASTDFLILPSFHVCLQFATVYWRERAERVISQNLPDIYRPFPPFGCPQHHQRRKLSHNKIERFTCAP